MTLLLRLQAQAEVILPILKKLREELGAEQANKIVASSLRASTKEGMRRYVSEFSGVGQVKWDAINEDMAQYIGEDINIDLIEEDYSEFNITKCKYAEYFKSIGEPELGAILSCECDNHIANEFGNQIEFKRSGTIMSGSGFCDFRYKFNFDK